MTALTHETGASADLAPASLPWNQFSDTRQDRISPHAMKAAVLIDLDGAVAV